MPEGGLPVPGAGLKTVGSPVCTFSGADELLLGRAARDP